MVRFTFRRWPFDPGEKVVLHWIRSPIKTNQNRWTFELVFKDKSGELRPYTVPWGSLPYFRLGQIFQDGQALDSPIRGFNTSIYIPDMSKCQICRSIEIPPKLYFLDNAKNWDEKCLVYKVGGKKIFIPCLEIVRSILAPMKILANALVRPQGLEDLIDGREIKDDILKLNLSTNVPSKIANNDHFVSQLLWLLYEENVGEIWDDIHENIFNEEKFNNSLDPVKLAVRMPLKGSRGINVRVLTKDDTILVLELSKITGLKRPYNRIRLFHHSFLEKVNDQNPESKHNRKMCNGKTESYYLEQTGAPQNRAEQVMIDRVQTILGFDEPIIIDREKRKQRVIRRNGGEGTSPDVPGSEKNKSENSLGTGESEADGDLMPAEFKPEFTEVTSEMTGLENFIKAVEQVKYIVKNVNIHIDIKEMPRKGTYPFLPNGSLRKYALVKFEKQNYETSYLLEIGRPDNKCLYTLVFRAKGRTFSNEQLKIFLNNLIDALIDNNGCWEKDYLVRNKTVSFLKMRHVTNRTPTKWAENIVEKLGYV